jgi:hypothetical protein
MANLAEIKRELGVETINLNTVVTESGEKTPWLKHWDNTNRIAILVHKDTLALITANNSLSTLGVNTQTKVGAQGEYVAKTIVIYTPAEITL